MEKEKKKNEKEKAIGIATEGPRIYFYGSTYDVKERIKRIGGHWDAERKQWWVELYRFPLAHALITELQGGAKAPPTQENPDYLIVDGTAVYQGRTYYLSRYMQRGYPSNRRTLRLVSLPDVMCRYDDLEVEADAVQDLCWFPIRTRKGRIKNGVVPDKEVCRTLGEIAAYLARQDWPTPPHEPDPRTETNL